MKPTSIQTIHPSGWPITFEIEPSDPRLHQLIKKLYTLGFRPAISGDTWMRTPEGLPICPKHNEVMDKREKQGDIWYSHALVDQTSGEKLYCRGYSGKSSPGFDLDTYNTPDNDPSGRSAHRNSRPPDPMESAAVDPLVTNGVNGHKHAADIVTSSVNRDLDSVFAQVNDLLFS